MSGPDYDAELEAFLKRRSPMHRRLSDIDHAEPSTEIDRLVLSRAREAIEAPSQPAMLRNARWAMPLGLAAAILIAFSVALNVARHDSSGAKPIAASTSSVVAPAAARAAVANESDRGDQPGARTESADTTDGRSGTSVKSANPTADSSRLMASRNAVRVTVPPAAPPPAPAASAESGVASTTATATASANAAAPAPTAADPHASPDSWLREINRLRAEGKTADADRELAAFRAAYPSHPAYSVAKPPAR